MTISELNKVQNNYIKKDLTNERYEWDDVHLLDRLFGRLLKERIIHSDYGKELSETEQKINEINVKINSLIDEYNKKLFLDENKINDLESKYKQLQEISNLLYSNYHRNKDFLDFNKVILLSGPRRNWKKLLFI